MATFVFCFYCIRYLDLSFLTQPSFDMGTHESLHHFIGLPIGLRVFSVPIRAIFVILFNIILYMCSFHARLRRLFHLEKGFASSRFSFRSFFVVTLSSCYLLLFLLCMSRWVECMSYKFFIKPLYACSCCTKLYHSNHYIPFTVK